MKNLTKPNLLTYLSFFGGYKNFPHTTPLHEDLPYILRSYVIWEASEKEGSCTYKMVVPLLSPILNLFFIGRHPSRVKVPFLPSPRMSLMKRISYPSPISETLSLSHRYALNSSYQTSSVYHSHSIEKSCKLSHENMAEKMDSLAIVGEKMESLSNQDTVVGITRPRCTHKGNMGKT